MQIDMFMPRAIEIMRAHDDKFPQDFRDWLPENLHVFEAFAHETRRIIARGFKHYSSYTIVEFLRHHSAISENGGDYKLNNNIRPYLPRLFDLVYPEHAGLWEFRETKKVIRENG